METVIRTVMVAVIKSKLRIYYATDDAREVPYAMRILKEKMAKGELR